MIPVQLRPAAVRDLVAAADWYERQQAGLGARFLAEADRTLSRIEASRDEFPRVYRDAHRALLRKFPFGIFFKKYEDRTLVVAISDLRGEISRWRERT